MWLITQLRANIPSCAAKIQIFFKQASKHARFFHIYNNFLKLKIARAAKINTLSDMKKPCNN